MADWDQLTKQEQEDYLLEWGKGLKQQQQEYIQEANDMVKEQLNEKVIEDYNKQSHQWKYVNKCCLNGKCNLKRNNKKRSKKHNQN